MTFVEEQEGRDEDANNYNFDPYAFADYPKHKAVVHKNSA